MPTTKEKREEYYKEENDLFNQPCPHENVVMDFVVDERIGAEHFLVCKDCGETNINQ